MAPDLNQPIDPTGETPLRRSEQVRRPGLPNDYLYLHECEFNIGQINGPSSIVEAMSVQNRIVSLLLGKNN